MPFVHDHTEYNIKKKIRDDLINEIIYILTFFLITLIFFFFLPKINNVFNMNSMCS